MGLLLVLRLFQAGVFAFDVILIWQIAKRLGGSRAAWLAVTLAALYTPFLMMTGRVMSENQILPCLLLWLWWWLDGRPWLSGTALFFGLSGSWFTFWPKLIVLGAVAALSAWRRSDPALRRKLGVALMPLLVGGLFLQGVTMVLPHQSLSPATIWYYTDTMGWGTLLPLAGMRSFLAVNGGPRAFEAYLHAAPTAIPDVLRWFASDPSHALLLLGANIARLPMRADNVYGQSWLFITPEVLQILHRLILAGAFWSFALLFTEPRSRLLWLMPLAWLVYTFTPVEARYNMPLMPFFILAAALGWQAVWRQPRMFRIMFLIGTVAALLLIHMNWYPGVLLVVPAFPLPLFSALCGLLVLLLLGAGLWGLLRTGPRLRFSFGFTAFLMTLVVSLPATAHHLLVPPKSEWTTPLVVGRAPIRQEIPLSKDFWQPSNMVTYLLLDTSPPVSPQQNDLNITVNGYPVSSVSDSPRVLGELKYLLGGLHAPESFRQYRMLRLPPQVVASLRASHRADIRVGVAPHAAGPVVLFGDYPIGGQGRYVIPTPDWTSYSIYKAQYDGDGRLPLPVETEAALPDSGNADLSINPGRQNGRYRVFLLRLLPEDAANPVMPTPYFKVDPRTGDFIQFYKLAY
jgi:hypothetical protein